MEMRARMSRRACLASLVVVVTSCGSPDEQIDASEAAASGASTSPSQTVPPSPETTTQSPPSTTHAPAPDPPAPEPPKPEPPKPPAPQPAPPRPNPPAPQPEPPAPNPNPPPGTVSYDLPDVGGSDLADEDNWRAGYANNCTTAGHPPDCLHLTVRAYAPDANGDPTRIDDPGPNYVEDNVYESCPVTEITPAPPAEVPVGTTVVITVLCRPVGAGGG